jgi:hypothetical protein
MGRTDRPSSESTLVVTGVLCQCGQLNNAPTTGPRPFLLFLFFSRQFRPPEPCLWRAREKCVTVTGFSDALWPSVVHGVHVRVLFRSARRARRAPVIVSHAYVWRRSRPSALGRAVTENRIKFHSPQASFSQAGLGLASSKVDVSGIRGSLTALQYADYVSIQ